MADRTGSSSVAGISARPAAVVSCWLCGIHRPSSQMVPDAGDWCQDLRWYCKDARGGARSAGRHHAAPWLPRARLSAAGTPMPPRPLVRMIGWPR